MKAQHYSIKCQEPDKVAEGQFVYLNNEDDTIRGFVYRVHEDTIEIVLFQPEPFPAHAKPVRIFLMPDPDAWIDMLYETLSTASEVIQWQWMELLDKVDDL